MADYEDSLFNLDVVREFIVNKGGKTTNHQLVTHFKSFLNDSQRKVVNRQKFKEIVNTLAIVKLDENGEKVLQLKKKYRDGSSANPAASALTSSPLSSKALPRNRPKAKKARLAETFEASTLSSEPATPAREALDFSETLESNPETSQLSEPSLSDMITGELSARLAEEVTNPDVVEEEEEEEGAIGELETPSTVKSIASEELSPSYGEEQLPMDAVAPAAAAAAAAAAADEDDYVVEPEAVVPEMIQPQMPDIDDVDSGVGDGASSVAPESVAGDSVAGSSVADLRSEVSDEGRGGSVVMETVTMETDASLMASPAVTTTHNTELEDSIISVKQRAQHLNRMESQSNLPGGAASGPGMKKKDRAGKGSGAEDDDTSSENSITITLTNVERKWMVDAAQANYQELCKALNAHPRLAKYKDFTSGYTALHWASKHGNTDIVKLLCGTNDTVNVNARTHGGYSPLHLASIQGHEDVIELLVQVYKADPDIRDHSGRKPKQYLRHSASSRSQQLLQPRRLRTSVVTGTSQQTTFRRIGSYSSKIRSLGGAPFGIQGGAALRTSWTDGQAGSDDRQSSSDQESSMPPPKGVPLRRHRSKRADSRENLSDSELPAGTTIPMRSGSDSQLVMQTETGV